MRDFDPAPAGAMLADAWRTGALLKELPEQARPQNVAEGYDIQDRFVAGTGTPTIGWKLGLGSIKGKRDFGIGRSLYGHVLKSHTHQNGDTLQLPNAAPVTIEFELAYVLNTDVTPGTPVPDVRAVIGEYRVTFELVLSRFVDRRVVGWSSFAGDNGGFHALVVGDPVDPSRVADIAPSLVIAVDGRDRVGAATGDDVTIPEDALRDLITTAAERGMTLPRGSIISTGALSVPFDISGASTISARYLDTQLSFSTRAAA